MPLSFKTHQTQISAELGAILERVSEYVDLATFVAMTRLSPAVYLHFVQMADKYRTSSRQSPDCNDYIDDASLELTRLRELSPSLPDKFLREVSRRLVFFKATTKHYQLLKEGFKLGQLWLLRPGSIVPRYEYVYFCLPFNSKGLKELLSLSSLLFANKSSHQVFDDHPSLGPISAGRLNMTRKYASEYDLTVSEIISLMAFFAEYNEKWESEVADIIMAYKILREDGLSEWEVASQPKWLDGENCARYKLLRSRHPNVNRSQLQDYFLEHYATNPREDQRPELFTPIRDFLFIFRIFFDFLITLCVSLTVLSYANYFLKKMGINILSDFFICTVFLINLAVSAHEMKILPELGIAAKFDFVASSLKLFGLKGGILQIIMGLHPPSEVLARSFNHSEINETLALPKARISPAAQLPFFTQGQPENTDIENQFNRSSSAVVQTSSHTLFFSANNILRKLHDDYLVENRDQSPELRNAYDRRFGLTLRG